MSLAGLFEASRGGRDMDFQSLIKANKHNPHKEKYMGQNAPPMPRPKPKAPKRVEIFKRKPNIYKDRIKLLKEYYSDVKLEYNEANIPTNLFNIFEEMLSSIPKEDLIQCETLGLFKDALEETIGVQNAKTKNKKYI